MVDILTPEMFVAELLCIVPELTPIYQEHIQDYDELLAHLLMGDVSRYIVNQLRERLTDEQSPAARALRFFEHALTAGDENVENILYVSFVENVAEYVPELPILRELIEPKLREMLVDYEPWVGYAGPEPESGSISP